jgi:hypothetical protein
MSWESKSARQAAVAPAASIRYRRASILVFGFAWAIAMARARRVFLFMLETSLLSDTTTIQQNGLPVKRNLGTTLQTAN